MRRYLLLLARGAAVLAVGAMFAAGAYAASNRLVAVQRERNFQELSDAVLRRAEAAIDASGTILREILDERLDACSDSALQAVRLRVYQTNLIKDIRTVDGTGAVLCSAYSETLEFDKSWPRKDDMIAARDGGIRLFRAERFSSDALGVFMDGGAGDSVTAIVGIDGAQLDVLPEEMRGSSQVSLDLDGGQTIAAFGAGEGAGGTPVAFERRSAKYPLVATVRIDESADGATDTFLPLLLTAASGLLGLLFGILAGRSLWRPPHPLVELDNGIRANEFKPYFQPIFSLDTRAIVGCEVLMRWERADGRIVGPAAFMTLAEGSGRIEAMTWRLLADAVEAIRPALMASPVFKMSVNVTPRHLLTPGFAPRLAETLAATGAEAAQIVLEVTEREEFADLDRAAAVVAELQSTGIRIALDDVGVGHSGLSHIQRLRADFLKVDKFFVDALGRDGNAETIIGTVVRLARELGMTVVAEGIENEAQLAALQACCVEQGQGYLVAPALAAPEFLALLPESARTDRPSRPAALSRAA